MDFKDSIELANKIRDCSMATVEDGKPRVRMMGLWFASKDGFYFQAWTFKSVDAQLRNNPNIEVCFFSKDKADPCSMMRVRGEVEFLEDQPLKEKMLKDRPFLIEFGAKGPTDPRLSIFRIAHGSISFWPSAEGKTAKAQVINF
ncbi:MAG: pyridoxamine 5'-phosphate oxidase family protein [Candidatus Paceibacterota bacterium]|jgi:uncharacterized pyridoxamine 5'-phosphate oxidase family protein